MGIAKHQIEAKRQPRPKKSAVSQYANMMTFHPTEAEKGLLREREPDPVKDIESLSILCSTANCSLTLGVKLDTETFYWTIREKVANWTEGKSLSCWHNDPLKALAGLALAIETRYSDFPDINVEGVKQEQDW